MTKQQRLQEILRRHNKKYDELCKDWERSQKEKNMKGKVKLIYEGEYIVKAGKCYMTKSKASGREYGTLEFEVVDGECKGRKLFAVFAGAFKLDVDHRLQGDMVHAHVTEILQSSKVRMYASDKGLLD